MPRSSGRYFSSTLTKLRSFKKAESILVDEKFQASLRKELLVRASVISKTPTQSFFENILRFKQHLALVPMLLLFLVAVVGLSKLSLQFKESAIISVAPTTQKIEQKPEKALFIETTQFVSKTAQKQEEPKTLKIPEIKDKRTVSDKGLVGGYTQSQYTTILPSQAITPVAPADSKITSEPSAPTTAPISSPPTVTQTPAAPAVIAPPAGPAAPPATSATTPNYQQQPPKTPEKAYVAPIEPAKTAPSATQPTPSPNTTTFESQPQYQEPAPSSSEALQVYFSGRFSKDEKILLKNDVIPDLIQGKNVSYVQVRMTPNEGSAVIEIYLDNEEVETYIYDLHEHTIVWQ